MSWPRGRREPYTEKGIKQAACIRCGAPACHQWQVCADRRYFRPLCLRCDFALNRLVLEWAGDPDANKKCEQYEKEQLASGAV
jgi:hypothetical protein